MPDMTTTTSTTGMPEPHPLDVPEPEQTEGYYIDQPNRKQTVLAMVAAALGGGVLTLVAWFTLNLTSLPAFSTSMVTKGLATAGTLVVLVAVALVVIFWLFDEHSANQRYDSALGKLRAVVRPKGKDAPDEGGVDKPVGLTRPRWRVILTYLVCYLSPAGLVVTTTAIPLASTKLYLDGIQVDQGFRTQFLTRMTDTWALADMNYMDIPTFYPGAWFWFGGRMANLLGLEGWEVYQPWALVSMAAAACVLVPVWQRISGSLVVATAIALFSTCIVLTMTADEPYAAIIALGVPVATVLARRAVLGDLFAAVGMVIYLAISASTYTLFTGVIALSVVAIAAVFAATSERSWLPLLRMAGIGIASVLLALIFWGPFLLEVLSGAELSGGSATHFLPQEGTEIPVPFLSPSAIGVLCLLGLIFLIIRAVDPDLRAMGVGLVIFYVWAMASMVATLAGSTLLGFRLDTIIALQLGTAGVLALADIRLVGVERLYPDRITPQVSRYITLVMVILLIFSGLKYAQDIPYKNQDEIDQAYTDTDGNGERGDRRTPDAGSYYAEINQHITSFGYQPNQTVVLTDEINFLAYNPYHGFQAFTSHYANPLGEFDRRNAALENWAEDSWDRLSDPTDFLQAMESSPWEIPDVFILRGSLEEPEKGLNYHIAEDIYPNNPNVRYQRLNFSLEPFTGPDSVWDLTQIGPFVVVTNEG